MLTLANLNITKLSGPVSFCFLVPKEYSFRKHAENGVYLPIVILLGDHHESLENRCDDCVEEKGCYKIESQEFLNALNTLGERIPIDYYTEIYDDSGIQAEQKVDEQSVIGALINQTIGCWNVSKRKTSSYNCAFKNIRWHKADARKAIGKIENVDWVRNYGQYIIKAIDEEIEIPSIQMFEPGSQEELFMAYIKILYDCLLKDETFENFYIILTNRFYDLIIDNPNSIINKKLQKLQLEYNLKLSLYRNISRYISELGYLNTSPIRTILEGIGSHALSIFLDIIEAFEKGLKIEQILKYNKTDFTNMFIIIITLFPQSIILDIYFCIQMLKSPSSSTNSYLSIGQFGAEHCEAISDLLLLELNSYRVISDIRTYYESPIKRCILFDDDIDIDDYIKKYMILRAEYESLSIFTEYLCTEYEHRGEPLPAVCDL